MPIIGHYVIILYSKYQIELFLKRQSYKFYLFIFVVLLVCQSFWSWFFFIYFPYKFYVFFDKIKTNFNLYSIVIFYLVPNNRMVMKIYYFWAMYVRFVNMRNMRVWDMYYNVHANVIIYNLHRYHFRWVGKFSTSM